MKIGIYVGTIPPTVFIENLVNGLADKNDTVIVYGKTSEKNYKFSSSAIVQRKVPITKLRIILYSLYIHIRLIIRQPNLYLAIAEMIRHNSMNWIQFVQRSCRILPPILDNLDIFHIQWAKTLVQYPEFIEKLKCPIVLSLRGTHINVSPILDEQLASSYKKYFPQIHGFHAVSQSISKEAEKYGADINDITVINPAIEEKLLNYKTDKIKNLATNTLHIISVGRCHWIKGYTFALDVMAILKKEKIDFHYTIIAGGRDQENILYQIHDLGLSECVTFINGLPHDEVIDKLLESDLFLLPSLEEGISNAVLEAMALEVSVISTECGGMAEVIKNGENGFLVPVMDLDALADEIKNIIGMNRKERLRIIKNAKQIISNNFLLDKQIDNMKLFYQNRTMYDRL